MKNINDLLLKTLFCEVVAYSVQEEAAVAVYFLKIMFVEFCVAGQLEGVG